MGEHSKLVVTGDMTQIDLPAKERSGLGEALRVLKNVDGVAKIEFNAKDIIRHKLVQKIVEAYAKHDAKKAKKIIPLTPKDDDE